jgi:tetratricopeptide (TPR) repeat protein
MSAREFVARRTPDDIEAAASAAQLAINADPAFSAAWSMLAEIRVFQATRSLRPPREAGRLAKEAAQRALDTDPDSTSALAIRGWVRAMIDRDCAGGLADLDRAISQEPDYWVSNLLRGWALQAAGRNEESVAMMRHALKLNMAGHSVNAILAMFLMFSGKSTEALKASLDLSKRFPTIDNAQCIAAIVCSVNGLHEEAIAFGWKAMELAPHTPAMHVPLAYALAFSGRQDEARKVLRVIEESNLPRPSAGMASAYLALGERSKAIELLKDASERGIPQFAWTRDDPRLASLHGDPVVDLLWSRVCNCSPIAV